MGTVRVRSRIIGLSSGQEWIVSVAEASVRVPGVKVAGHRTIVWERFKRDRLALASGVFLVLLLLACFLGEPLAVHLLGHGPNDILPYAVSEFDRKPVGPWSSIPSGPFFLPAIGAHTPRTLLILGGDGPVGRDELLRLLAGGQASLEIAFGATAIAVALGTTLGAIAGFYRGWVDAGISRLTEFVMGFPILLLFIALGMTVSDRLNKITVGGALTPGVLALVLIIGLFSWFYIARVVRTAVLSLREQEFVEAARSVGASNLRILRTHILPHLVAPIIVYASIVAASTIILESALSFLGLGITLPYASWGNMIATNWGTLLNLGGPVATGGGGINQAEYVYSIWTTMTPTVALFATVFALNLVGEGLRRALDPHSAMR